MSRLRNFYNRYEELYATTTRPLVGWLQKKDLMQTAHLVKRAGPPLFFVVGPLGILLPAAIIAPLFGPLAAAVSMVLNTAGVAALCFGAYGLQEAIENSVDKKKTKTITNLAGQTVTGTAYDLGRLQNYERRADFLGNAIAREEDAEEKARLSVRLKDTFAEAAPHIARVTVTADPAAPEGSAPAFAFATTKTATTRLSSQA